MEQINYCYNNLIKSYKQIADKFETLKDDGFKQLLGKEFLIHEDSLRKYGEGVSFIFHSKKC